MVNGSRFSLDAGTRLPTSTQTCHQDINMVDKNGGEAESVIPPDMLQETPSMSSRGSRAGAHYTAANGGRMLNLGDARKVPHVMCLALNLLVTFHGSSLCDLLFPPSMLIKPLSSCSGRLLRRELEMQVRDRWVEDLVFFLRCLIFSRFV